MEYLYIPSSDDGKIDGQQMLNQYMENNGYILASTIDDDVFTFDSAFIKADFHFKRRTVDHGEVSHMNEHRIKKWLGRKKETNTMCLE